MDLFQDAYCVQMNRILRHKNQETFQAMHQNPEDDKVRAKLFEFIDAYLINTILKTVMLVHYALISFLELCHVISE